MVIGRADAVAEATKKVEEYYRLLEEGKQGMLAPLGTIVGGQRFLWPGGRIPYEIAGGFPNKERIYTAIAHWEAVTPIRFIRRNGETDYVRFIAADKCSSLVGKAGNRQYIKLAAGCGWTAVAHKIGHAVGLHHEQKRPDRDNYIEVKEENIKPRAKGNFKKSTSAKAIGPYNYGSIMHYHSKAFSANSKPTIITKPPNIPIGRRGNLNDGDLQAVAFLLRSARTDTPAPGHYRGTNLNQTYRPGITHWQFSGRHRLFIRIRGGDAALSQRCLVYRRSGHVSTPPSGDPHLQIGGGRPTPGFWHALPVQTGPTTYTIIGQHFQNSWVLDTGVQARREIYDKGLYYFFGFDDAPGHIDYNDFVVEMVVISNPAKEEIESFENVTTPEFEEGDQSQFFIIEQEE